MFEIEKNVKFEGRKEKLVRYPFAKMEVGDSFVADHEGKKHKCKAAYAARSYGAKVKGRFSCTIEGEGKIRIFRVE